MGLKIKTAPATEPITTAEAKLFLRVDHSSDDALIATLITAARQMAEDYTKRAFITQTWNLWLDRFPMGPREPWWDGVVQASSRILNAGAASINIPRPPLASVTHVKTYDDSNTATTFTASDYIVDTSSFPGRLTLHKGAVWPADLRAAQAVDIEFICGYGATAADVPAQIRQALFHIVARLYECREEADIPAVAQQLLNPYRVIEVGDTNPTTGRY